MGKSTVIASRGRVVGRPIRQLNQLSIYVSLTQSQLFYDLTDPG